MNTAKTDPKATLIGMSAVALWGSMVGLLAKVSSLFGATLGVALVYSVSALLLLAMFRVPSLAKVSKRFLLISTLLFVAYELCFSLAVAHAQSAEQAIEVSLLNYLWPCFTIVALVLCRELKFSMGVLIGLGVCIYGVMYVQGGGLSLSSLLANAAQNPLSYALAFIGAIIWAVYCAVVRVMGVGQNLIALYFVATAFTLWLLYAFGASADGGLLASFAKLQSSGLLWTAIGHLLAAGLAIGLGYGVWNYGILHGNAAATVVASYFTPVLSSLIAALLLSASLTAEFWLGVVLVSAGSLICYVATKERKTA
ncbi:hypothetical protein B0181_04010 [Moraxella caviae]|uniref:Aromatic amino acid exporter YddG n=1 Tax=Moraxella caviae TaxID=34060 RepID=A0A1T0A6Z7_9GAMM|nr:aromatic amino acid DMT transporter YddG [Moraxella caviae]OOR91101.1 hypothetical protein B0181_04010 [Moraxella caviae]STZ14201.1 Aromatic amino acid exporter YddG [Moraxella caviae]VEW13434.1 Aromatic amino acid exporter YddG [Moraxella caviae]